MADYWKSNAKHFCEVCKIWIADNRASREHHEKGNKHKGMVQQKIRDMGKRAKQKEAESNNLQATLIAMEQAALAAMKSDGQTEAAVPTGSGVSSVTRRPAIPRVDPKLEVKERKRKLKELKRTAKASQFWDPNEENELIEWVQAENEGQHYYWNIFSGETTWEVPNRFYTTAEYNENFESISKRLEEETKKQKLDKEVEAQKRIEQQKRAQEEAIIGQNPIVQPQNYDPRHQLQYIQHAQQTATSQPQPSAFDLDVFNPPPPPEEAPKRPVELPYETTAKIPAETVVAEESIETEPTEESRPQPELTFVSDSKSTIEQNLPRRGGLLGNWIPIVQEAPIPRNIDLQIQDKQDKHDKKKKVALLDDLPEQDRKKQKDPVLNEAERKAEIEFKEKVLPDSKSKKTKLVAFRKSKTAKTQIKTEDD